MEKDKLNKGCEVLVIGGSAGSIDALLQLFPALPGSLSFAMIIVLHRKNTADSTLTEILAARTRLPVNEVDDKDPVLPGHIYLAPADYHLLIEQTSLFSLDDSEKVNYSRPSLDVTFESAADIYGPSLVGVLLSGANSDGTQGLAAIKKAGGIIIAQKPESAKVAYMPQQAILNTDIDFVFDMPELASFIQRINHPQTVSRS